MERLNQALTYSYKRQEFTISLRRDTRNGEMYKSVRSGDVDSLRKLIEQNNITSEVTPLTVSVLYDQEACLIYLLDTSNTHMDEINNALYDAVQYGSIHCIRVLLSYGADPNRIDIPFQTCVESLKLLIDYGATFEHTKYDLAEKRNKQKRHVSILLTCKHSWFCHDVLRTIGIHLWSMRWVFV